VTRVLVRELEGLSKSRQAPCPPPVGLHSLHALSINRDVHRLLKCYVGSQTPWVDSDSQEESAATLNSDTVLCDCSTLQS
jgi:hypothetical protein